MGAVDLVIQVESPKSVARGLQRDRPRRPRARRRLEGPHLPEVPGRPARVRRRRARDARTARSRRRRSRATRSTCSRSRSSRSRVDEEIAVDELHDARPPRVSVRRALARRSSRTSSTCSPAATRPTSSPSCGRASSGTAPAARSAPATARAASPSRTPARSPTAASSASSSSTAAGASASSTRRWSTRRAPGQTFLLGASTWRIEEITRDRVLVSPAPGLPGAVPFWKGEGVGRPFELGREDRRRLARALGARRRDGASTRLRDDYHLDERAARNLLAFLREQADATGAVPVRPHDRRRALPRRDRRLARLHPHAVRRPRARAVGDGDRRAAARVARRRGAVDLVGRRDRAPLPRRRRAAAGRRPDARAGRGRGPRRRRARRHRALRRALPRERRAGAADPAAAARRSARRSGSSG